MTWSTAEAAEQAKGKLSEAAQKGKETAGEASRPVQIGIRAPTTPDHKVRATFEALLRIFEQS